MKNGLVLTALVLGILIPVAYLAKNKDQLPPPENPVSPFIIPNDPIKEYSFSDAVESIKDDEVKRHLFHLTSQELEGRMSGKNGNRVAAEYIKTFYEKDCRLSAMYHKFAVRRMNPGPKNETGDDFSQNIYAWIEGNDPSLKNEVVVVGAHFDHIGYGPSMSQASSRREVHPGADDNASGTVALMEIAQAFSMLRKQVKRTVVFMSFSGEEMGLVGARYYCDNPVFPKESPDIKSHVAMINMDMVGRLGGGNRVATSFDTTGDGSSPDINGFIKDLTGKYSFASRITGRGGGGSDHACFYNKRIPVAMLHTGMHRDYHTPDDTAEKINISGLKEVARYCFELAWKVSQSESKPQFNHASFQEVEYSHDHLKIPFGLDE